MKKYTMDDVGVYLDGSVRGSRDLVLFACDHGMPITDHLEAIKDPEVESCIVDECIKWMNENHGVDGAQWCYWEGDFGLWWDD